MRREELLAMLLEPTYCQEVCNKCDWKSQIVKDDVEAIMAAFIDHNTAEHDGKARSGRQIGPIDPLGRWKHR